MKAKIILATLASIVLTACEQTLEVYNNSEGDRLIFRYDIVNGQSASDPVTRHTFVYDASTTVVDTVWLTVNTMGYTRAYDRNVSLRQVMTDSLNATVGTHFVSFTDPALADKYVVKAGSTSARIPIVLLRDASLKNDEYFLKFEIVENEFFKPGVSGYTQKLITVSDILTQPQHWDIYAIYYFAGQYGKAKHQFMIDAAAPIGVKIDDNFFYSLVGDPYNVDMGLTDYWFLFFTLKLEEENARRLAAGLDVLREEPTAANPLGEIVEFTQYMF
jgi:hypothetical protein